MSSSLQDKILRYPLLSLAEQREVEQHVQEHPDLLPLFEEVQALAGILHEAQRFRRTPLDDEALAYYVATKHVSTNAPPPFLQEAFDHIEAQLQADPALQARRDAFAERLQALDAAVDPVDQFERLTGHTLTVPHALEEPTASPSARRTVYLGMGAAGVVLFAVYVVLAFMSARSVPAVERLAAFTPSEVDLEQLHTHGSAAPDDLPPSEALYLKALPVLRDARTSTLGLFPHYDSKALARAASLLEEVAGTEATDPALRLEAQYLLAKVRLAQHSEPDAEALLRTVVAAQGWRSADAMTLLEELEKIEG